MQAVPSPLRIVAAAAIVLALALGLVMCRGSRPAGGAGSPAAAGPVPGGADGPTAAAPRIDLGARGAVGTAPVPGVADTGSLAIAVTFDSGEPAPAIWLRVERGDDRGPVVEVTTDAGGHARLDGLAPGDVVVRTLRQTIEGAAARIVAGECAALAIVVDAGLTVAGRVVDGAGRPVPDARIEWVVDGTGRERAIPCGTSDARGLFEVVGVPERAYVGARKAGFVTSLFARARTAGGEVVLRLVDDGGAVAGEVVDADGAAVAGASVVVGRADRAFVNRMAPEYGRALAELGVGTVSDAAGRFVLDGVPPGEVTVAGSRADLGEWVGVVDVAPGGTASVRIELAAPGRVTVVVREPGGVPVGGVRVELVHALSRRALHGTTDGRGIWCAEAVTPGPAEVRVTDGVEDVVAELEVGAGANAEVAFELAGLGELVGRVVDRTGAPRAGLRVVAELAPSMAGRARRGRAWTGDATADDGGWFTLRSVPRGAELRLSVLDDRFLVGLSEAARVGGGEVVIEVDTASTGYGRIRGAFVRPDRLRTDALVVGLIGRDVPGRVGLELDDHGTFEQRVREGRHELVASGPAIAVTRFGPFTVAPGATLDVGVLPLTVGGQLAIRAAGPHAAAVRLFVIVDPDGRRVGDVAARAGRFAESAVLPAGVHRVLVRGAVACAPVVCGVVEGRVTEVVVAPIAGREVRLVNPGTGLLRRPQEVLLTLERDGEAVFAQRVWTGPGGEWRVDASLAFGTVEASWVGDDGARGRAAFTVGERTDVVVLR